MRFEVRIPTYQRPEMLRRALESLQRQTYSDWKAIIFDDSSASDASEIVRQYADERILYVRNPKRLGGGRNIDQCLCPSSIVGGDYGCLLEDDNFWFPDFLLMLRNNLKNKDWSLVLANQRIYDEGRGLRTQETTRGDWFLAGAVEPLRLRAALLLMEGLSNGGLVWRLGDGIDLRVGHSVHHTSLHEACRSLLVKEPFLFIEEPLAVWTSLPKQETARASEENRVIGRGMQSIRDYVLCIHGYTAVSIATGLANRLSLRERLITNIAYSGFINYEKESFKGRYVKLSVALLKGKAIRLVQTDPCKAFLKELAKESSICRVSSTSVGAVQ